jgi:molecular chaperone GrpE (heat shock protein)
MERITPDPRLDDLNAKVEEVDQKLERVLAEFAEFRAEMKADFDRPQSRSERAD